ncbi:hypothetical protein Tco_0222981 [Tanacetum coccineum]
MTNITRSNAIQEEIMKFKRLEVWELVPCPDKVMLIKLKWIYKVKTDKFWQGTKIRLGLVAQGISGQEEGINLRIHLHRLLEYEAVSIFVAMPGPQEYDNLTNGCYITFVYGGVKESSVSQPEGFVD